MRIFLVGFMGSGKTTIGKILAEKLQYAFVDLDEVIESDLGESIHTCFETKGELYFRQKETICLKEIIEENIVIATGGGTPCFNDNLSYLKENGLLVYLNCSVDFLFYRLSAITNQRPLLKNIESEDFKNYISETLLQRETYYKNADIIYNVISNDLTQNTTNIINEINPLIYGKQATRKTQGRK
ncbi:MAG: hypothetical protein A2275_07225 [Bacteroidetes bacterium RIFOXYA12_FULL_35_11]|nr:MAG: hypothetical protein A2X01_03010 [Bacteroidetes bacterium GWF2_35_48]OFY72799.1 MAG: hypothetical protein A2275_07225 [Bacteroidetes bacterium RIFOXYA12_FULL_35_11]OFY95101.1 MAG: hypothetical protein A2491_18730 [Bacteroidetes bacterium RIFOXYC12_FULL_35_7]HBX52973.1 shikimate kinase [Bacteroidales bacterium]